MNPPAPDTVIPPALGRYQVRHRLGVGGMGAVYLARSKSGPSTTWVAVKTMLNRTGVDQNQVKMFLDEARIASMIDHPHVAHVVDFGSDRGVLYLAMEYLHGEALAEVARTAWTQGGVPSLLAARIVADAAHGLHAAHELLTHDGRNAGVIHRDVSPQNLFVLFNGVTKIVDFGVARANERLADATSADVLKGKIGYMAPEQLQRSTLDRQVDVWGLGVVLWEITTGRRLFKAENEAATILAIVQQPIPRPSSLQPGYPPELERIVMRALERDRAVRYPTAEAVAQDLERFIAGVGVPYGHADVSVQMVRWFGKAIAAREQLLAKLASASDASSPEATRASVATQGAFVVTSADRPFGTPRVSGPVEPAVFPSASPASPRTAAAWLVAVFVVLAAIPVAVAIVRRARVVSHRAAARITATPASAAWQGSAGAVPSTVLIPVADASAPSATPSPLAATRDAPSPSPAVGRTMPPSVAPPGATRRDPAARTRAAPHPRRPSPVATFE